MSTKQMCIWLEAFVAGERSGLDELLGHLSTRMQVVAKGAKARLPMPSNLETSDLLQDMHLRLLSRWEKLAESIRAVPSEDRLRYFFGCTATVLLDIVSEQMRRTANRAVKVSTFGKSAGDETSTGDSAPALDAVDQTNAPDRIAMWAEFHEFVDTLPNPLREVADLYWYHGLTHAEVGETLGIAEVTSRVRWAQVRHKILLKFPEAPFPA